MASALAAFALAGLLVAAGHAAAQEALTLPTQTATIAPGAAAGGAGGAAAVNNPCQFGITFFPPNAVNQPSGWTQPVQQNAGNNQVDQMVKIALAGYPTPQLYVAPVSIYTQVGGAVPVACLTGNNQAGAAALVRPAAFTVTWALQPGGMGGVLGPFTKGSKQDPPANVTLNMVPELPDGDYCVQIKVDLVPGSGLATVGSQQFPVPVTPQSAVRQVCFIMLATRPTANITFRSCNTSFAVDLTNIRPKPMYARYPDVQMFSIVFHVWGTLNRTFDDQPQGVNMLNYFDQYVRWTDLTQPPNLQVFMDQPGLVQGFYDVWIEGSLSTQYPDLVNLFGYDSFADGTSKYMGQQLRNNSNKPVPIQTVKTKISNIDGPSGPTPIGELAQFSWDTDGYGEQFCFVDGQRVANAPNRVHCSSPLNLKLLNSANHTLNIIMNDVCGDRTENMIFFGTWGWQLNPMFTPPAPPAPALGPDVTVNETGVGAGDFVMPPIVAKPLARQQPQSGAGAASPRALAAAAAGLLALLAALL